MKLSIFFVLDLAAGTSSASPASLEDLRERLGLINREVEEAKQEYEGLHRRVSELAGSAGIQLAVPHGL